MCRVCVRLLQRAHVLANEAAARAGRGQAIAPTLLRWILWRSSSIVGATLVVALERRPRPGALQKSYAHPYAYVNLIYQSTYCMLDENWEEQGELFYEKESLLDSSGGTR